MAAVFLKLFNMSIAAGWVVLAVLVLRLFFKKIPKWIPCMLWGLVGIRLICPFAVESIFSLLPSAETVPQDIVHTAEPAIHSGVSFLNSYVNPILSEKLAPTPEVSVSPMEHIVSEAAVVWLLGVLIMLGYGIISYLRLYRIVREGAPLYVEARDECCAAFDIWLCDYISTPFILGVFRPRIFLPSAMDKADSEYVIAHETAHLKRLDHWWKPVGFVLLTIYWFHPLMWIAYILLCRDIELACDERVIKDLGQACKKPYLQALINCSAPRKMISACPLAFGEVDVERRIKNVLHYKKPAVRVLAAAALICIIAAVCLLTNPFEPSGNQVVMDDYEKAASRIAGAGTSDFEVDCIEYVCRESPDIFMPRIKLYMQENSCTFSFSFSALSSFLPHGTFEITDTELILKTEAPVHTYTFRKDGANYIFDAEKSSLMPQYYYGLDKGNAKPVEGGAVFEPLAIHFSENSESGYSAVIDSMMADIDKDGEAEVCTLTYGRTSGLFTFILNVREYTSGELKYYNVYTSDYYEFSFLTDMAGNFYVQGKTRGEKTESHLFKMEFEDGNIVLVGDKDGERLAFWGEQGVDSKSKYVN